MYFVDMYGGVDQIVAAAGVQSYAATPAAAAAAAAVPTEASGGGAGAKAQLVAAVKYLQRTDPVAKDSWWNMCDNQYAGNRDPSRHDELILRNFLDMNGGAENLIAAANANPAAQRQKEHQQQPQQQRSFSTHSKDELVQGLKHLQRTDPSAKQAWQDMCDNQHNNIRDPNRHSEAALISFLDVYGGADQICSQVSGTKRSATHSGFDQSYTQQQKWQPYGTTGSNAGSSGGGGGGAAAGAIPLAYVIKSCQRISPAWKNAWHAYCDANGQRFYDPSKHEDSFLQGFIERTASAYNSQNGVAGNAAEPAAKRQKVGSPEDPYHADMVKRVKELQKSSEAMRTAWQQFCEVKNNNVRDPLRHTSESIMSFLTEVEYMNMTSSDPQTDAPDSTNSTAADEWSSGGCDSMTWSSN